MLITPLTAQSLRQQLFANGFRFVPVYTGDKKPYGRQWPQQARALTAETAAAYPQDSSALNTGILADGLQAVDVDTDDLALAQWIVALAQQTLGGAPIRFRANSPKCLLLYRAIDERAGSANVVDVSGKKILEVLGVGRQFVAYGMHPSGVPYQWMQNCELTHNLRNSLTAVSPEQIEFFLTSVAQHVGGNASRTGHQDQQPAPRPADLPIPTDAEKHIATTVLARICAELRETHVGGRNIALNNAALQMGEMCGGWGVDRESVGIELLQAMYDNGYVAAKGLQAAKDTIASGFSKGLSQPRARNADPSPLDMSKVKINGVSISAVFTEKPRPLRRAIAESLNFPIESLGPFYWPTYSIADKIQCPVAIAALSVLGVASLAVQAHADVRLPRTGHVKPLSLFLVSIGESGERKSAADNEAKRAITECERDLAARYDVEFQPYKNARDAWESERQGYLKNRTMTQAEKNEALNRLGPEPQGPLTPMLTCPEPTFEGLCALFSTGYPALGVFSDEGGHFVGGHALSEDTRLRTAAGLSSLWDGSPIKRVRAARENSYVLPGRRLAMHLMLQPNVAAGLLSDPVLKDQGLLSRILVSYPQSTAGTRFHKEQNQHAQSHLDGFTKRLGSIVKFSPLTALGKRNELTPRVLQFDNASHQLWEVFADRVEKELAPFGKYESIRGLANKLPEHAARIAGVMTVFENFQAQHISVATLEKGIILAEHFASEALRLFDAGLVRPEIALAESLLQWLTTKWTEPHVSVRMIQQFGPNAIRDSKTAKAAIDVLVEHGWLARAQPGTIVQGNAVKDTWLICRN